MVHFLKYKALYFFISLVVITIGAMAIAKGGLRFSIEFTGGSYLEYALTLNEKSQETARQVFQNHNIQIKNITQREGKVLALRTNVIDEKKEPEIRKELNQKTHSQVTLLRFETVGPTLGRELIEKTIIASLIGMIVILFYIAYAFKSFNFAFSAIVALLHDVAVVVGMYAIFGLLYGAEVDSLFVTAILTTMSFSVHDTIVIFDKIREYAGGTKEAIESNANKALTETMVRSFNNSMTIVFMLLALSLLGGSTIRFFVIALLVGTITGTYSSPFIATPVLVALQRRKQA